MAKATNYTPEQEKVIRERFAGDVDHAAVVRELAEEFGKSLASVRQKAVTLKVYRKKVYTNKNGAAPETKEAIVSRIAKGLNVTDEQAESLVKANKAILLVLAEAVAEDAEDSEDSE